jgi:hypothetical protein
MNCEKCQRRLLACERPEEPAGELLGHLASCSACRDYQQQILQLERALGGAPVPSSAAAKERTLKLILTEPLVRHPLLPDQHHGGQLKDRGLRKMAVAFALAASLLLFAFGLWTLRQDQPQIVRAPKAVPVDPLAFRIKDRNERLAGLTSPRERVEVLADLTQDLQDEGQILAEADDISELKLLVRFHQDVIDQWLVKHAGALPLGQRKDVLEPVTSRLLRSVQALRDKANGLASPEAKEQLDIMARAANDGDLRLLALLPKG